MNHRHITTGYGRRTTALVTTTVAVIGIVAAATLSAPGPAAAMKRPPSGIVVVPSPCFRMPTEWSVADSGTPPICPHLVSGSSTTVNSTTVPLAFGRTANSHPIHKPLG